MRFLRKPQCWLLIAVMTCSVTLGEGPSTQPAIRRRDSPLITKHENETFENQTVYISGQAFIHCKFIASTLVIRESIYHLDGCVFERCNWHIDMLVMWGDSDERMR